MIVAPIRSRLVMTGRRLDARFYCSPGVRAGEQIALLKLSGVEVRTVGGLGGFGRVLPTSRSRRVYAGPGEANVPYLRPYDVFDFLPQAADLLSKSATDNLDQLVPSAGTILQTCSGRNLGPSVYADDYLAQFAISDDMLRLVIDDQDDLLYVLTFLNTPTGQSLLTRNKTGAVIDHLSAADLAAVEVPVLTSQRAMAAVEAMRQSTQMRGQARQDLARLIREFESSVPQPQRSTPLRDGWTVQASALTNRIDSAYQDPLVVSVREQMLAAGGILCKDVATAAIPGRYTRYYVEAAYGRPILSGRQLLQSKPINLRHIASRSFDFGTYELKAGMLAFGAEGRAEDRIAMPALITPDRDGWLANNHVMRVVPRDGVNPGALFLAFAAWQTQAQVKACSCGSVVDAVYVSDLLNVVLPPLDLERGTAVTDAWGRLAQANALEAEALGLMEAELQAA